MNKLFSFVKNEIVFVIALFLAIISAFIIKPSPDYIDYIDFKTLALLLALMLVVQGLKACGLFDLLVLKLLKGIDSRRKLAFMLVSLCFLGSMLITNDVALITFVPFTVLLLSYIKDPKYSIYLIVLETIAANLGSMFTPIGNPQNLYLYSISGISIADFLLLMLPYTLLSFVLLLICILFIKSGKITTPSEEAHTKLNCFQLIIYIVLFLICILSVISVLDFKIMLAIVTMTVLLTNFKLITKADYILLLTFIAFFIFIGNMKCIPEVSSILNKLVSGRECIVAIGASQIISNVPCAMLLSGFTQSYTELIVGTNLGGLGTIIASMASLISFKFYNKTEAKNTGKYMLIFTILNILFLLILLILYLGLKKLI